MPHRSNLDYSCIALEGGMDLLVAFSVLLGAEQILRLPTRPAYFAYRRDDAGNRVGRPSGTPGVRWCRVRRRTHLHRVMPPCDAGSRTRDAREAAIRLARAVPCVVEVQAPTLLAEPEGPTDERAVRRRCEGGALLAGRYFVTGVDASGWCACSSIYHGAGRLARSARRMMPTLARRPAGEFGRAFSRPAIDAAGGARSDCASVGDGRRGRGPWTCSRPRSSLRPTGSTADVGRRGALVPDQVPEKPGCPHGARRLKARSGTLSCGRRCWLHDRAGRFRGVTANLGAVTSP